MVLIWEILYCHSVPLYHWSKNETIFPFLDMIHHIFRLYGAQCAVCKVRCHYIFYGPGIRYSDIFGAPGIRYSVIIKLPCALLQTGHLETVHAPVADTVAYFADLDAPVVDTVTYFGGNHRSRV